MRKSNILSVAVAAVVVPGLFATVALPAYALTTDPTASEQRASRALEKSISSGAQHVDVALGAPAPIVVRPAFSATSSVELHRKKLAAAYAAYRGPSTSQFLANPPYPHFNLAQVASVALKYIGVPYRFGGANPSGFDCSGLTQYVYAQFGVYLPHSASAQARMGKAIAHSAALPGDLVIVDGGSHVGIYLGGGRMVDAPRAGEPVTARAIYTSDYYFVRVGI